jgi:hypothetical protein
MMERALRVLALGKYGERAASSRQRMVQYRQPLAGQNIQLEFEPLLSDEYVKSIADERRASVGSLLRGYLQRIRRMLSPGDFDLLWVQADLLPYFPGFLEAALLLNAPPIVYDCDDAFFHAYETHNNPLVRGLLAHKLRPLLRRAIAATCGNEYLKAYVERYCASAVVVPTVVDTHVYRPKEGEFTDSGPVVVGWIGSASTWSYVTPLVPILRDLTARKAIAVRAIGVGARSKSIDEFTFVDWALETEVEEIHRFDVGIMPLTDDPWSRGKCGYKLVQYMACGLPVVAAPVGVNTEMVRHGENGFLASTEREWREALEGLVRDRDLRRHMGAAGRERALREYSLISQAPRVADIMRTAAQSAMAAHAQRAPTRA